MYRALTRLFAALCLLSLIFVGCNDKDRSSASSGTTDITPADACEAGNARRCLTDRTPEACLDGVWQPEEPCPEGQMCEAGECSAPPVEMGFCTPMESRCVDAETLEVCNEDGTQWELVPCATGVCVPRPMGATCGDNLCTAGERTCNGDQIVVECGPEGEGFIFAERCNGATTGQRCDRGQCVPLCVINEKVKTNVGCDYWAADLDNALVPGGDGLINAARAPFAVVVSNPHPSFTAEVSVYQKELGEIELVDSGLVPPYGLHVFSLPHRDIDHTDLTYRAYRIRSSIPIVAYQFNPLDNEDVFSNDASLLLPSHVIGDRYFIMSREQSFARLRGFMTIIGISEEPTSVTLTLTARTQPGNNGIPSLNPGDEYEVILNQYEVLNIETSAPGADLTGTLVEADGPVVVFGGSEAANVPNTNHCVDVDEVTGEGVCESDRSVPCRDNYDCNEALLNTCCADHLEQQLFPIKTWGRHYVASKSHERGLENDYWRILAAEDGTKVETVPPQTVVPTLNRGDWFEFGSREHFQIISDKPILVGQYLASEHAPNPNRRGFMEEGDAGTGDPAFILAIPVEQYRSDFVLLAPDKYAYDYVSVTAPPGAEIFFDDQPIPVDWEPVGDGEDWVVARFQIADGVHFIQSDEPLSVIVYGYDQYVSYGYPGGLNLDVVDPESGEAAQEGESE